MARINLRIILSYKSILHRHGVSEKYCVVEIPSNILYHIEYSYDYTEVAAGYPTFSIAYLIYSTSHIYTNSLPDSPNNV